MSEKLKHCPFCGGEAKVLDGTPLHMVICTKCNSNTSWRWKAIDIWNKRTRKETRLKPCPLCGCKAEITDGVGEGFRIQCKKCGLSSDDSWEIGKIIKAWNRRANNEGKND